MQPLDIVRGNSAAFVEALIHVLRKHGGIQTDADYAEIMNNDMFTLGSKHLSYIFRHNRLTHEDGSLSLNELLNHGGTTRKIRQVNRQGHRRLEEIDETQVSKNMKSRNTAITFLMPLAHICCNSNKSHVQIGFLTRIGYEPGKLANLVSWFYVRSWWWAHGASRSVRTTWCGIRFHPFRVRAFKPNYGWTCQICSKQISRPIFGPCNKWEKSLVNTPPRLTSGRNSWRTTRCPFCP